MTKNIKIVACFAVCLSAAVALSGCPAKKGTQPKNSAAPTAKKVLDPATLVYSGMDGKKVNIGKASKGKPVFVTLFASWCKACAEEVPKINEIFEKYGADGVVGVYAINVGDSKKKVERMIADRGIKYTVLLDEKAASQDTFELIGLPLNVVFDRNGKEIYRAPALPPDEVLAKALAE